jgi:hypothetical protein
MSNEPENTTPEAADRFSPDNVRENALSALEDIQNATLNIGRITDPEYLASLTAAQLGRIKKVITDRNGVIVSVELNDTVGLLLAKANIAGVKENTAARNREKLAKLTAEASAEARAKAEVKKSELKTTDCELKESSITPDSRPKKMPANSRSNIAMQIVSGISRSAFIPKGEGKRPPVF